MPYHKTTDGCRIFFEDEHLGSPKPLVVLLNGTLQTSVNWVTISRSLQGNFQVLTYDGRAQGRSERGSLPLSLALHSEDLRGLLHHVGAARAHLVGISHGAAVALAFASRFPDAAGRLVLCGAGARPSFRSKLFVKSWIEILNREGIEAMARAALPVVFGESFLRQHQAILDEVVAAIVRRNKQGSLLDHLQAMMSYPPLSGMALDVRSPTLALSGSDDPLVTDEDAEALAALCRGRHRRAEGVGHSLPAEAPELFVEVLQEFLSEEVR